MKHPLRKRPSFVRWIVTGAVSLFGAVEVVHAVEYLAEIAKPDELHALVMLLLDHWQIALVTVLATAKTAWKLNRPDLAMARIDEAKEADTVAVVPVPVEVQPPPRVQPRRTRRRRGRRR